MGNAGGRWLCGWLIVAGVVLVFGPGVRGDTLNLADGTAIENGFIRDEGIRSKTRQ